jgi:hypothetical protein
MHGLDSTWLFFCVLCRRLWLEDDAKWRNASALPHPNAFQLRLCIAIQLWNVNNPAKRSSEIQREREIHTPRISCRFVTRGGDANLTHSAKPGKGGEGTLNQPSPLSEKPSSSSTPGLALSGKQSLSSTESGLDSTPEEKFDVFLSFRHVSVGIGSPSAGNAPSPPDFWHQAADIAHRSHLRRHLPAQKTSIREPASVRKLIQQQDLLFVGGTVDHVSIGAGSQGQRSFLWFR